jgi:hypothetical protein
MAPTLSSNSGVSMTSTNIVTSGIDRDVVSSPQEQVILFFTLAFDFNQFQWNSGFGFRANFQVENYASGLKTNVAWNDLLGALPQAPSIWLSMQWTAANFGISTPGVYLYRPTFTVMVPNPGELPAFIGDSDFAVAEEHFLILEGF